MYLSRLSFRQGFTLVELLVSMVILLVLTGLTLVSMRASRNHLASDQAAARLVGMLEGAQGLAAARNEPVYLVVAGPDSEPGAMRYRAFTLILNPEDPRRIRPWEELPDGLVFGPVSDSEGRDLVSETPMSTVSISDPDPDSPSDGSVSGEVLVLLRIDPDGQFRVGPDEEVRPAALSIRRGTWFVDNSDTRGFEAWTDPARESSEVDRLTIHLRPRTGVAAVERVMP